MRIIRTLVLKVVPTVIAGVSLVLASRATFAADDAATYPDRPVRVIVAAAAGGFPDVLARLLTQALSKNLGKAFVVENAAGAGGVVAAKSAAAAAPDGYTLMVNDSGGMAINVALNPNVNYRPPKDFTPIAALATAPTGLVLNPEVPAKTLAEFVALAKSKPGRLSYGTAGAGSIHHLTMALFAERAGIELLHAPFRGGTAAVNGLLTHEVDSAFTGLPNIVPLIADGKLRALCVSTVKRAAPLPEVPGCAELGYPGFDIATMFGLSGPATIPPAVVTKLRGALARIMDEPTMRERMKTLGLETADPDLDYGKFMAEDVERYAGAVARLNLRVGAN